MSIEWFNLTNGSFNGYQFHIAEPKGDNVHGVSSVGWSFGRRLQRSRKPLVDGASVRDLGGNEREITFSIVFFGRKYLESYLEFENTVTKGQAGSLIIPNYPRAIQCYFADATVNSSYEQHNTFLVNVTFVQDEVTDQELNFSETKELTQKELADLIIQNSSAGLAEVQENEYVSALRSVESGLSATRRFSSRIINLDQAVRNRIASVSQNLEDTYSLLGDAISVVEQSSDSTENTVSGFAESENERDIVSVTDNTESSSIDEDPVDVQNESLEQSLSSSESIVSEVNKIKNNLLESSSSLNASTGGNNQESVVRSELIRNLVNDYLGFFEAPKLSPVLINRKTSLIEIMFKANIDVNSIEQVHKNNLHLDDCLVIQAGEVVYL